MLNALGELTRNLLVIIFLNVLLEMLLPQGHFHRYIRLVTGLVLILMVLNTMSLILGRAPASVALLPQIAPGAGRLDENLNGLGRISRDQALKLYRENLVKLVLRELEALGGWKLRSARFTLEEDPYSEQYGAVRGIELVIRAPASAGAGDLDPAYVEPVTPGDPQMEKTINLEEKPPVHTAVIAQTLADRLQISAELVRITVE